MACLSCQYLIFILVCIILKASVGRITPTNVALGKPTASNGHTGHEGSKAVDGIINSNNYFSSVSGSWDLDLNDTYFVRDIRIVVLDEADLPRLRVTLVRYDDREIKYRPFKRQNTFTLPNVKSDVGAAVLTKSISISSNTSVGLTLVEVQVIAFTRIEFKPTNLKLTPDDFGCLTFTWYAANNDADLYTSYEFRCYEGDYWNQPHRQITAKSFNTDRVCYFPPNKWIKCGLGARGTPTVLWTTACVDYGGCVEQVANVRRSSRGEVATILLKSVQLAGRVVRTYKLIVRRETDGAGERYSLDKSCQPYYNSLSAANESGRCYIAAKINGSKVTHEGYTFVLGSGTDGGAYNNAPLDPDAQYSLIIGLTAVAVEEDEEGKPLIFYQKPIPMIYSRDEEGKPLIFNQKSIPMIYSRAKNESYCMAEKFYKFNPGHTGCFNKSEIAVSAGVLDPVKKLIVNQHNKYRALQNATNMQKMVWDDEIAEMAQRWTDRCMWSYGEVYRYIPGRFQCISNIAAAPLSWESTMKIWYETRRADWRMLAAQAARIGCGYTYCPHWLYKPYYSCSYSLPETYKDAVPYKRGKKCADCPRTCVDNLCDCGGKVCENGGTLDLNTCSCKCLKPWHNPGNCTLNCEAVSENSGDCASGGTYGGQCLMNDTTAVNECPDMCNICPYAHYNAAGIAPRPTVLLLTVIGWLTNIAS